MKTRLDGTRTNLEICGANGIHVKSKYSEHQTEAVIENYLCKTFCNVTVQTDHLITTRKPCMILIDKEHHKYQKIDFVILCRGC